MNMVLFLFCMYKKNVTLLISNTGIYRSTARESFCVAVVPRSESRIISYLQIKHFSVNQSLYMEKIVALIDKLQELKHDETALSELAYYTQRLYAELMCAKNNAGGAVQPARRKVAVIMPGHAGTAMSFSNPAGAEVHEVRSEPVYARRETPERERVSVGTYEPVEAPVLVTETEAIFQEQSHQGFPEPAAVPSVKTRPPVYGKELNEVMAEHTTSLNDRLKAENLELATKLNSSQPVRDLTKAVGINDKFLFINELFRGDRNMFDRSVKTINECGNFSEADYWIGRELKIKLGWQESDQAVQQFYALVRKRFC